MNTRTFSIQDVARDKIVTDLCQHAIEKAHKSIGDVVSLCRTREEQIAVLFFVAISMLSGIADCSVGDGEDTPAARREIVNHALAAAKHCYATMLEEAGRAR